MTRNRRRIYLFAGALSVLLPLVGFTYALAQGAAPTGGVSLNWPSLLLTLIGAVFGTGVTWGTFGVQLRQHGEQLKSLDSTYMRKDLCDAREGTAEMATAAANSVAAAHQDMQELVAEVKKLLKIQGG